MSELNNNQSTIFGDQENEPKKESTIFGAQSQPKKKRGANIAIAGGIAGGGLATGTIVTFVILGIVLLALVSALVTFLIIFNNEEPEPEPSKFDVWEGEDVYGNAAHLAYPLIDEKSVTKIELYKDGKEYSFIKHWLEDSGTYDWRIESLEEVDLNATNFELLRMWLCTVTTKTPIRNATESQLKDYKLDKENYNGYKITFKENDVEKSYTVRIGDKASSKDEVHYAYIEGRNHVYKISSTAAKYAKYDKYEYLSPAINTFFANDTNALMGIKRFDVYLTDGSNTALKDVVTIKINEKDGTAVEFKAIYGADNLGRRRTTIASTTYLTTVFSTLYTAFSGDLVVAVNPTDEELSSFGLASEQEKYYLNVEFEEKAAFASATYKNKEPSLYISRLIDDYHYVLSEYYGIKMVVKVKSSSLPFLGETQADLIKWTDINSAKTSFNEAITVTDTEPGLEKIILKTPTSEETFILSYNINKDVLTVTGVTSGLVFEDNSEAETSFGRNRFRNLYVYLLYYPFIHSFNEMSDDETLEYIKSENLKYSITAFRNDGTVIKYSYYATSASLAIERVEEGKVTSDGVSWDTPSYGNIVTMEHISTVTNAINKLLDGGDLLPDEEL